MSSSFSMSSMNAPALPATHIVAGAILVWLLVRTFGTQNLRHIPTEGGPSLPIISFLGLHAFLTRSREILEDGYQTHKGRAFKVALIDRWLVVLSGKKLVEELQKMPDDTVESATTEMFNMQHVFASNWHKDPVHSSLLRSLTRNLGVVFSDMFDELDTAFRECVPANAERWLPVQAHTTMASIVTRAANRIFVGLPVCRDAGYIHMMIHVAEDVSDAVRTLSMLPTFMKPFVARRATVIDQRIQQCLDYLRPAIADRMSMLERFGKDWEEKPNDVLQWIIDEVTARNQGEDEVARIVLFINFGAIETTSFAVTHALYDIVSRPGLADVLREEVEAAVATEGWTKAATNKMRKLDSVLRESQRLNGPTTASMFRRVLQPVTLSDGTYLPAGTTVVTPTLATHFDDTNYADAQTFDPLRFYKPDGVQAQLVTTSADFVTFGHGKHACPGRFFAANELKAMMAYILMHYDIRPEREGVRPENVYRGLNVLPDANARVFFRRRQTD